MASSASHLTEKDKKGVRTKAEILRAARKIFSRLPYHAASIRMIGKEAGVEHPLINYYFPSKAGLFETVLLEIYDEYAGLVREWLGAVIAMDITEGLMKFIDEMLDYNYRNPESFRILALNVIQADNITQIPGYKNIPRLIDRTREIFEEMLSLKGPSKEIKMYIHSFCFLAISFLGAGPCMAQLQGMDPESKQYREWVRSTLGYIFIPRLKEIINPGAVKKRARNVK